MTASNEAQIARINIEKAKAEAEATVLKAQAEAEALRARGTAGVDIYAAKERAKAESQRMSGMAEADVMHAKGDTYQQETSRQIGLEAMQNGLPGTGANGGNGVNSAVGDMIGLGVTLGTVGSVVEMTKNAVSPVVQDMTQATRQATGGTWNCSCGKTGIPSKFCPECGSPMPVSTPVSSSTAWNCTCGCTNITSKFCPECGQKNPLISDTWTCTQCGNTGIKTKFCPECGHPKEA